VFYTIDIMKGVIVDLDCVLADSMPMHYEAWKIEFSEAVNIDVDERTIYLLEGMRGMELVKNNLGRTGPKRFDESSVKERVNISGKDLVSNLLNELVTNLRCRKAVVSRSSKNDAESILGQAIGFGKEKFDVMITADEVTKGKPDPSSLISAMEKLKLKKTGSIVGENAPLGVEAANRAGIPCIVVLNNTPLGALDFKPCVSGERILKPTELAFNFLQKWCNE
jgi:beta-phosphoglucomutase